MSYKVLVCSFGLWLPATHKYFKTKQEAEKFRNRLVKYNLGGNIELTKIVEVKRGV